MTESENRLFEPQKAQYLAQIAVTHNFIHNLGKTSTRGLS
jgi:hypothetical protein